MHLLTLGLQLEVQILPSGSQQVIHALIVDLQHAASASVLQLTADLQCQKLVRLQGLSHNEQQVGVCVQLDQKCHQCPDLA